MSEIIFYSLAIHRRDKQASTLLLPLAKNIIFDAENSVHIQDPDIFRSIFVISVIDIWIAI